MILRARREEESCIDVSVTLTNHRASSCTQRASMKTPFARAPDVGEEQSYTRPNLPTRTTVIHASWALLQRIAGKINLCGIFFFSFAPGADKILLIENGACEGRLCKGFGNGEQRSGAPKKPQLTVRRGQSATWAVVCVTGCRQMFAVWEERYTGA